MKIKKIINYIIVFVVLLIPFIYSFFYLKAYWNPYGKGNIDNLPVAVVNEDTGEYGNKIIDAIKASGKLKLTELNSEKAKDGLYDGTYYATITIPANFSDSILSVNSTDKVHPILVYSPNQKSNFLASQIINTVVLNVEKSMDNEINANIIKGLTESIDGVPDSLNTISDGMKKIEDGTSSIKKGTNTLKDGTNSLYQGTVKIDEALNNKINELKNSSLDNNTVTLVSNKAASTVSSAFTNEKEQAIGMAAVNGAKATIAKEITNAGANPSVCPSIPSGHPLYNACQSYLALSDSNSIMFKMIYQTAVSTAKETATSTAKEVSASVLKETVSTTTKETITSLTTLKENILNLENGAKKIDSGVNELNKGASTLDNGVNKAINKLDGNIKDTKKDLKKVETLAEYSSSPLNIETKNVNEVTSYGTAFSPLFISIGLWVGSLMMFVVLFYDKKERFGILLNTNKKYLLRSVTYHGLVSGASLMLGLLLQLLLDFDIANIPLYYLSILLTANLFMALMNFLIVNFDDVGKFLALIILVLQLAASGGTFPIEVVSKCFRFLNPYLPMTYTINLLKEAIIGIDSSLLTKNIIVVAIMLIILLVINTVLDIIRTKKA